MGGGLQFASSVLHRVSAALTPLRTTREENHTQVTCSAALCDVRC